MSLTAFSVILRWKDAIVLPFGSVTLGEEVLQVQRMKG
jgi:hypothetical protein